MQSSNVRHVGRINEWATVNPTINRKGVLTHATRRLLQMVRRNDLEFYDRSAKQWWYPDAKIYALHHLNPLRFKYFVYKYLPEFSDRQIS